MKNKIQKLVEELENLEDRMDRMADGQGTEIGKVLHMDDRRINVLSDIVKELVKLETTPFWYYPFPTERTRQEENLLNDWWMELPIIAKKKIKAGFGEMSKTDIHSMEQK